jgi:bifunctional non-homologous end joining protein LigD
MAKLGTYRKKRDFSVTAEPRGASRPKAKRGLAFVVQKHHARRLHWDFRLEWGGVLLSWAVPKEPVMDPAVKRLAVHVEDHPYEYRTFEGTIPKGNYGAGTVAIWDHGTWVPVASSKARGKVDVDDAMKKGHLSFELHGDKLHGRWHLVRTSRGDAKNWLLFKGTDADQASRPKKVPAKDPWPAIEPELALLVEDVPEGDDWLHEVKYDGYRIFAHVERGHVKLESRNHKDWTARMPTLASALEGLVSAEHPTLLLDGEVVALDEGGVSRFQRLQNALGTAAERHLVYYVFDVLYLAGNDVRALSLAQRKELLAGLIPTSGAIRFGGHVVGNGRAFFQSACRMGLEGIVSKRSAATYRGGRNGDWRKIKCVAREEVVIGGFTEPSGSRSGFGALLVGTRAKRGAPLVYAGKVGTGFDERSLRRIFAELSKRERADSPFATAPRGPGLRHVHWVEPELVAEVSYLERTSAGKLRHPSFLGLREDKSSADVVAEHARPTERT